MKLVMIIESMFTEYPYEDRFRLVKEAGYDYVELWDVHDGLDLKKARALADQNGLTIASISGDLYDTSPQCNDPSMVDASRRDEYIEKLVKSMEVAKQLGASYLHVHSNAFIPNTNGIPVDTFSEMDDQVKFANMVYTLKLLAPIAEKNNLTLILEACNKKDSPGYFLNSTNRVAEIVRCVDSPNIRVVYDIYHAQIMEGNLLENIRKNIDIIGYFHLSNVPNKGPLDKGEINFAAIAELLDELNYEGFAAFEIFPHTPTDVALASIKKYFK